MLAQSHPPNILTPISDKYISSRRRYVSSSSSSSSSSLMSSSSQPRLFPSTSQTDSATSSRINELTSTKPNTTLSSPTLGHGPSTQVSNLPSSSSIRSISSSGNQSTTTTPNMSCTTRSRTSPDQKPKSYPPSSYSPTRSLCNSNPQDIPTIKGKGRMPLGAEKPSRPSSVFDSQSQPRRRSDWVVDPDATRIGGQAWNEKERVILVVGSPTVECLSPILHNPQFEMTLLLISSSEPSSSSSPSPSPSPSLEALASLSSLMHSNSEQPIYPHVQLLKPKTTSISSRDNSHFLPPLLEQATTVANQWRMSMQNSGKNWMSRNVSSRRGSMDSTSVSVSVSGFEYGSGFVNSPPTSPQRISSNGRASIDSQGSRGSFFAGNKDGRSSMSQFGSNGSLSDTASISGRSTRTGLFSKSKLPKPEPISNSIPFDAVIHFLPNTSTNNPQKALQEMLQSTVMLTSAVTPILSTLPSHSNQQIPDQTPITLIHVIPQSAPLPVPSVVESFLLSFMPRFQAMSERQLRGLAVGTRAWNSRNASPPLTVLSSDDSQVSGVEVILFGGLSSNVSDNGVKSRAYLDIWPHEQSNVSSIGMGRPSSHVSNHLPHPRHSSTPSIPSTSRMRYQSFASSTSSASSSFGSDFNPGQESPGPDYTIRSRSDNSVDSGAGNGDLYQSIYESYANPRIAPSPPISGSNTINPRSRHPYSKSFPRIPNSPTRLPTSRSGLSNVLLRSDLDLDEEDENNLTSSDMADDLSSPRMEDEDNNRTLRTKRQNSNTTTTLSDVEPSTPELEISELDPTHSSASSTSYGLTSVGSVGGFDGKSEIGIGSRNEYSYGYGNGPKYQNSLSDDERIDFTSKNSKTQIVVKEKGFGAFMRRLGRKTS